MLEIEQYYNIDELADVEIWKREYNIPPREMSHGAGMASDA
jgi:hypothetical protein